MVSLTGLSEAGLKACRSHLINSHFLQTFGVCLWVSFTRVVQSWSGALQAQIPLIHTPHRTIMFSLWFSLQGCPELACSPPVPDAINSHPLELLRFTYGSLSTELSNSCLEPWRPRFHSFTPPTARSCFPHGVHGVLHRIV